MGNSKVGYGGSQSTDCRRELSTRNRYTVTMDLFVGGNERIEENVLDQGRGIYSGAVVVMKIFKSKCSYDF